MAQSNAQAVERRRAAEGSVRETIESIIIAFVLAFVFRAFVVEAFVIPTGSMAPTLLGQPVATALLAIPLLGEPLTAAQVLGGALVLAGIAVIHRRPQTPAPETSPSPAP